MRDVNVAAAVISEGDKILIAERMNGRWEFPGGKKEGAETTQETLKREINEELGCTIETGRTIHKNRHKKGGKIFIVEFISCKITAGTPKPKEHRQINWASREELKNYDLLEPDMEAARKISSQ